MKRISIFLMTLMLMLGLGVSGHAAVMDMGDETIYDTDTQLTWLKNSGMGGLRTWDSAMTWADSLNFAGFDNWRLPTTLQPDSSCDGQRDSTGDGVNDVSYSHNCTGSEMGHLFYDELGGQAHLSWTASTDPDMSLFTNIQTSYWSGTEYAPDPTNAWLFYFEGGHTAATTKSLAFLSAWAVRPGERTTSVPEPGTLLLLGVGLTGMVALKRKLRRRDA